MIELLFYGFRKRRIALVMERAITIIKTKGIGNLEFSLPHKSGVYLLVGGNGAGKTTILTALHRICDGNAFSRTFRSSVESKTVDRYKESRITYRVDGNKVSFSKKEKKWAPTPKSNGFVLSEFGFLDSVFIKASDSRLSPREEEIRKGNLEPADEEIKSIMNRLFDTERFSSMQRLRNTFGRGRAFTHFYVMDDGRKGYYSEKSFSTGELAMLRLVERTRDIAPSSLILLDEAELALHPRVQLRLLDYLSQLAAEKNLTVFVSTHSPTMIRASRPAQIMLLSEDAEGSLTVETPCHPAYAMGFVDEFDDNAPDYVLCVEDVKAQLILREVLGQFLYTPGNEHLQRLQYRIIPVAGWKQTLEFVRRSSGMLFCHSCVRAVLDADVFERTPDDTDSSYQRKQAYVVNYSDVAFSLGVTPEVGIVSALEKKNPQVLRQIRDSFHADFASFVQSDEYVSCKKKNPRSEAKAKLDLILAYLSSRCAQPEDVILARMIPWLIPDMYTPSRLAEIAGKILSAQKK